MLLAAVAEPDGPPSVWVSIAGAVSDDSELLDSVVVSVAGVGVGVAGGTDVSIGSVVESVGVGDGVVELDVVPVPVLDVALSAPEELDAAGSFDPVADDDSSSCFSSCFEELSAKSEDDPEEPMDPDFGPPGPSSSPLFPDSAPDDTDGPVDVDGVPDPSDGHHFLLRTSLHMQLYS